MPQVLALTRCTLAMAAHAVVHAESGLCVIDDDVKGSQDHSLSDKWLAAILRRQHSGAVRRGGLAVAPSRQPLVRVRPGKLKREIWSSG